MTQPTQTIQLSDGNFTFETFEIAQHEAPKANTGDLVVTLNIRNDGQTPPKPGDGFEVFSDYQTKVTLEILSVTPCTVEFEDFTFNLVRGPGWRITAQPARSGDRTR